jgi:hypothetical protein
MNWVPGGGGAKPVGTAGLNRHAHYTLLTLPAHIINRLHKFGHDILTANILYLELKSRSQKTFPTRNSNILQYEPVLTKLLLHL